ncbi:spinster family MFS transporter [Comamonas testosteroni]|uniref:spinster family MFS transporter n=1 Tax=Comamonas testosteroni TaxID=285 RepID=UPI001E3BB937|nr:MFS transporter [Comamonas testosteroni]
MHIPASRTDQISSTHPAFAQPSVLSNTQRNYMLFVLFIVYSMAMADRNIMGVLIQPVQAEFGISDGAMGLLTGLAFALFYSVLAIPFGRYADRSNRRNLVAWCCLAWSIATALCGLAVGFWTLAAARVAVAIGEAGGSAPSVSMIADAYPTEQRSRAMGIYMLGAHFGVLFGLGAGAWIAQEYGWRHVFIWMAIPGMVVAMLLRFTCVEPRRKTMQLESADIPQTQEKFLQVLHSLRKNHAFVGIATAGVILTFAGQAIGIWNTSFLVRSYGLSLKEAGAIFGVLGASAAVTGALISAWLTDRLIRRDVRWQLWLPAIGVMISIPFGIYFYLAPAAGVWPLWGMKVPHALPAYLVFGVLMSFWVPPTYAALTNVVPSTRMATAMAIFGLCASAVGGGLGPLIVGLISDGLTASYGKESLRYGMVAMVGCCLVAVLCYLLSLKDYVRMVKSPEATPTRQQ